MIDTEKLAIKCGANTRSAKTMFEFTPKQLKAFAKAYLNEWLKEQEVVATCLGNKAYLHRIPFVGTKLIALPSEVK